MSVTDGIMLHNFTLPAVSGTWMYSPGRDVDPGWTAAYTGTPDIVDSTNREGQGYMYYQTQTANGTKVALDFIGTRVHLCIRSDDAKYQFTVDGTIFELPVTGRFNDPQCIALGAPTTLSSDLLPQGAHRAELTVLEASPSSEFRFFGGVAVSELVVDIEPSEVLATYNVDDLDAKWASITQVWTTKWITTADEPLAYEKTTTVNCNYGIDETNSIDITGASAALLYGFLDEESHYYSVELDGTVFNGDASTSMWRAGSAPIFMRAGLDPSKNYTLTYRNYNENFPECGTHSNGLARRCCGSIDRLQLFGSPATVRAQTGSPSTAISTTVSRSDEPTTSSTVVPANLGPSSSSSPVAAIIAGVLGGLLFVCIIALLLCWRWHGGKRRVPDLGRPNPLASEDAAREDAVEPWLESLQDYITAYHVSTAMSRGSSTGEKDWTTKPLPALPRGTSPSTSASESASSPNAPTPGAPLRPVDMRLILAYVAARMDPPRAPGGESSAVPPSYQ